MSDLNPKPMTDECPRCERTLPATEFSPDDSDLCFDCVGDVADERRMADLEDQ